MAKKRTLAILAILLPIGVSGMKASGEKDFTTYYAYSAKDSTSNVAANTTARDTTTIGSASTMGKVNTGTAETDSGKTENNTNGKTENNANSTDRENTDSNARGTASSKEKTVKATSTYRFGYLSYNAIFKSMPEYAAAQKKLQDLKKKYDQEAKRGEDEFQRKFVDFIQGQKDFPENILLKRQYELQKLMEESVRFKEDAQVLLTQAEKDLQTDMLFILNEAIRAVGIERGYSFIINTDGNSCPFINPAKGEDVTNYVKQKLQIPVSTTTGK